MDNPESLAFIRFRYRVLWPFIGWALFFAPMLLALAAYCVPNMLRGLVLLRTENTAQEYIWDCAYLAAMGMFVSALGVAIVRIFELYALLQFRYRTDVEAVHCPVDKRTFDKWWWNSHSTAWPLAVVLLWLLVSMGYPLYCCWETRSDIEDILKVDPSQKVPEVHWAGACVGILSGSIVAGFFLLLVSVVHIVWTRKSRSACGLLPFEDIAAWLLDRWLGPVTSEQTPSAKFSSRKWVPGLRWILGPGFFGPSTEKLLPGHLQLFVFMAFAAFGYYLLFDSTYGESGWPSSTFHVGVYALLLMFLVGGVVALASFVLGRLRFHVASIAMTVCSGILLVLFLVRFGADLGLDTNRYFSIVAPKVGVSSDLNKARGSDVSDKDGSFVQIAKSKVGYASGGVATIGDSERKTLKDVFGGDHWHFPRGPDNKRTMVVVTASGGGIQASAWTAKVLTELDEECSNFSESIGLVSGVSGGSVGSMYYLGKRGLRKNAVNELGKPPVCMSITEQTRREIQKAASDSSLEAIGWGLAFPDLARMIPGLNLRVGKEDDRGLALESQLWTRMRRDWLSEKAESPSLEKAKQENLLMRDLRMRDLLPATNNGLIPPVIFNTTTVETGQRMMIATFATNPDATSVKSKQRLVEYERLSKPIDFFGFYEPLFVNPLDVNPRVSTAVRLSSSFAYVTPVARPIMPDALLTSDALFTAKSNPSVAKPSPSQTLLPLRKNYHLCDGGYSENTGLVGAVRVITDLINQHIDEGSAPPFDRILFLSIESFPDNVVETEDDSTGISSGVVGPLSAIFASRVASQAERAELELELLIRSEDQAFSKKSAAEIMAVFDVDRYEDYRSNAEKLVSRINSSSLSEEEKEDLKGYVSPVSTTKLRPDDMYPTKNKIPLQQANFIKSKATNFIEHENVFRESVTKALAPADQSLVNTFIEQSRTMSQLDVPNDDNTLAAANSVFKLSIACIQFRFDPRSESVVKGEVDKSKRDSKVPDPPLSWMLSPYDKFRIDMAWENQLRRLKGSDVASAASATESGQRLLPPETLQRILKFDKPEKRP